VLSLPLARVGWMIRRMEGPS